ncbi:hypothetical protein [Novosphingobium album (ex Hu et al. 2023)]|uniref:Uncharacterized protein n=1 Tax=Novosphingobium album (ex Hu et al. 2023) TaxID=2930093 RepID=A0ABT0AZK6_9SPHN|nr:hypothetical protein [Novosphingobium album (ex Hu et al. 2023)]MCJ2178093.1 hypothetical protein [Novosphingobium album (ex Hu et al. 2023)]
MIKRLLMLSPLFLAAFPAAAEARPQDYAEGQVWQYATRAQDAGSLVKIQRIEMKDGRPVYHVSVIGAHFAGVSEAGVLEHLPVSEETLDTSVTRQVPGAPAFAGIAIDADIAEWRAQQGGVLNGSLAQVLNNVDAMLSAQAAPVVRSVSTVNS